VGRVVN